ncbi:MAG: hypothetical protein AAB467_03855 [Patescibacteria group bacterium]|mgnify:CR=1 FL=1
MTLLKKILLYFPLLIGLSMVLSIPVGLVFTKAQYEFDALGVVGNTLDYFFNGMKLSYMFLMLPLGVLLELPIFLIVIFPLIIVILKLSIGTFGTDQAIAGLAGVICAIVVFLIKKRGYFDWFNRRPTSSKIISRGDGRGSMPNFITNLSIFACVVFLTYFLSFYVGEYILVYLNDYFRDSGGGSWIGPPPGFMQLIFGVPVTYAFFTGLLFNLFGKGREANLNLFVVPAILLSAVGSPIWLLWTIVFFVVGFYIAKLLKKYKLIKSN